MSFDPTSATPEESFDPTSATLDTGPSPRDVARAAVPTNPDQAAAAAKLAKKYNAPDEVLLRNLQDVQVQDAVNEYSKKLGAAPVLADYMRKSPFVAKQSHDDIDALTQVGQFFSDTAGSVKAGVFNASRGAAGVFRSGFEFVAPVLDVLEPVTEIGGNPLRRLAEGFDIQAQAAGTTAKASAPKVDGILASGFQSGIQSLTQNALALPLAFAPGGQGAALSVMTASTGGNAYQDAREKGLSMSQALPYAASQASIEWATEKLPLLKLVGDVKAGTPVLQTLMRQVAAEVPGEQVATLLQDMNEWAVLNPTKPFSTYLEERPSAAAQTLIATIVGVGGNVTVSKGIEAAITRATRTGENMQDAEANAQRLAAAMQAATASKLRERNPETFQQLVQHIAENTDGAPQSVYIDAQVLAQSGVDIATVLPGVVDQLDGALAANSFVEVPIAEALANLPGTPLEQVFLQNARSAPDALSLAEAEQAGAQATEYLKQEADRVLQQAQDQSAWQASSESVKTTILDQLNQAGRFTPEVNEAYATLQMHFFSTMAARVGITPQEMYDRFALKVSSASKAQAGQVLNAGNKTGEISVEGYHFSMADRPTLSTEFFGRGLKGSARDEIMSHPDERIKQRLSFYVDLGKGILPETGVGGRAHRAQLTNIYDSDLDPLKLRSADARAFESKVLDAGFSGYLSRMGGASQGQVILLGKQSVQPELLGPKSRIEAGQRAPALPVEPAKWEVQASGEPSMLQAKLERMQSNPSWAGYDMRVEGRELQVRKKGGVFEQSVSTRLPTAKKALENPLEDMLIIGLEAAKADPKAFEKNVELIRQYPNFRDNKSASTPDKAAEQFIKHVVDNLLWLYDQVPAATRQRSKLWYDGARAIVDRWVPKYNVTDAQAAGMLAVLSPQKDWFQNVSLAERVLDVMTTKQDFAWSDEMSQTAASIGALNPEDVGEITGKTLGEIDSNYLQAVWVRVYDQTYNERGYRVVSPEGDFTDWVYNTDGTTKSKTAWGSFNEIGKAISIFKDGSVANISASLGEQHKVRNFYNNIFNPASQHGDVTIDTHAVAAGLLRPLSGSAAEVIHNFGAGGAASSSVFGSKGTYGIYAEAYRRAADQRGVLPREMQSITWEAVRGLYTAGFKAQASNVAKIDAVWEQYKKRRISLDEARKQLLDLSGGIAAPEWERPSAGTPEAAWASSYTGELRQDSGTDRTAGPGAGGVLAQSEPGDLTNGRPEQTGDRGGRYSSGSLAPLEGAPAVAGAAGPDPKLVAVAEQYARDNGIDLRRQDRFVDVDEARAARIAQAYAEMRHAPNDPKVKEAYDDLIRQTRAQYDALVAAGYEFTFFDETGDPYGGNPWNAMRDLRANQRMAVYGTYAGFGVGAQVNIGLADPKGGDNLDPAAVLKALREVGAETEVSAVFSSDTEPTLVVKIKNALTKEQGDRLSEMLGQEAIAQRTDDEQGQLFGPMAEKWGPYNPEYFVTATGDRADAIANPLLRDTGLEWPDQNGEMRPVLANDLFRAVHDAFGHGLEGAGFRARGEENAWQAHVRLFTGPAVGAITSETRGQNSWLNYGPYGEKNRNAAVEDTVFAEQKTGLMPEWTWTEGRAGDMAEVLEQGPRGTYNPQSLLITLNENADLSTFLHESGHFFLEVMADLASQPNTPQQIRDDMAQVLKWFGVPDIATWNSYTLDQKRPYHEKFAESFEAYLLEGKAPSQELQPLFRRFRSWLVNVYKSLKDFMRGRDLNMNDEVRQVFDRMLATDEQIAQAEETAGMLPDFDATNEAIEKLQARSLRDLKWTVGARSKALKALQKEAANLRKAVEAEVRAEVEQQPVYAARKALRSGDKLSIEGLESLYMGEGDRYALLDWKPLVNKKLAAKTGMHPDIAADMFGFKTGDELVRALLDAEPIDSVIEGITDRRMLENFGELATPEAIEEAANDAVHNEARARSLATELKAQAEALNPREDTGRTASNGRPITVNALAAAAKEFAENLVARRKVKDLKNAAWQHRAAEARAGKAWQDATAKGKTQEAVQAKRDQMLNNYAAKAMGEAQAEVKKILDFFARVTKGNNEKTVERGRDPDVVNAARAILAAYEIAPRLEKGALEYLAVLEKNDPTMYAALQPSIAGAVNNAKPVGEMSMEELRGLKDEIDAMWHLAKRSRQMEVDGNLLDIEDAASELQERMQEIGVPDTMPGDARAITNAEKRARWLQHAGSLLRRAEQWAEGMDGKFGGPFLRLVFQPVKEAANRYRADRVKYRKAYQALVDNVAPALRKGTIAAPELGYTFGEGHNGIGHAELLHAILHTGNESNKRKLLLGRRWATENADGTLDTSRWDAFVTRMQNEGILAKEHYDFAQGVWDLLEQTKPLAQKTHRDVFGRYFDEVTADSFDTPFGTYRGGYVPAQADPRIVQDADLRKLAEAENENMAYSFPSTNKGFTKGRVEYNRPLLLDLRTIGQHIDKVLLFSHMEPAVRDVNKLLSQKGVSYSLGRIDPTIYAGMLTPWLSRSARQIVETPILGDGGISRVLSAARSRAGMALMFANVSNSIQQLSGFSNAFAKLKADGLNSQMLRATAQFIASPKEMARNVAAASEFMNGRMENEIAAINDAMDAILLDPNLYERAQAWTQKHAYFMQSAFANTMEPIIWTAGYNAALEKGMNEKDAVRYADALIRQTQGSTLPEDVSRIETGPAYGRMFTQFIGYFNNMANTNATALKQIAQDVGLKKGAGKALLVVTTGMLVPLWVAEAIAQAMRGGPDDEDDDGYLDDWLAAVFGMGTIKGSFAMIPFIGQFANVALNKMNGNPADDRASLSPAVSLLEAGAGVPKLVYQAITDPDKVNARNAVRDVASALSIATGIPFYAAARPLGYMAGVADDKIEPTGPVDAVRGAVTGTPSEESRVR